MATNLVIPTVPLNTDLAEQTTLWNANNPKLTMKLYKNNYTPVAGSVLSDFTEANFSGYAAQDCTNWSSPQTVASKAQTQALPLQWTNTTGAVGNDVYGYFVVDSNGLLRWAQRDPNPPVDLNTAGKQYLVVPTYTRQSQF